MTQPARAPSPVTSLSRLTAAVAGLDRGVLVVAPDPLIAEALSVALSASGIPARVATALPLRGDLDRSGGGTALVVLGATSPAAARRVVASLVGAGRRVAVVVETALHPALADCIDAGAEAIIPAGENLSSLVTVLSALDREGPIQSPIDLGSFWSARHQMAGDTQEARLALADLTRRELEILAALMAGKRAAGIAQDHFVSMHTVRTQIRSILRKLKVSSQIEAVAVAHRAGWLS